jgi:predicted PurR-regulated permease PerM
LAVVEEKPLSVENEEEVAYRRDVRFVRAMLLGLFIFASIYALYFARDFFMPVVLAFLLALMLTPIVRLLRWHGIPEPISATVLVVLSLVVFTVAGYLFSGPIIDFINNAPALGRRVAERLAEIRSPFERLVAITDQIEQMAAGSAEPGVQRVVVSQPGIISAVAGNLLSAGTSAAIVFVLSLFLLASGTLFYEKIVQSFTRMSEKKRALRVVYDVEREISRYLLTITIINFGLGAVVGVGLWALGMPTPYLFGAVAAVLNFLPYIGALGTIILVAGVALVSFDSLGYAVVPPLFVLACNILEGQFITPLVVGRRLEINAVAVFIAVAFWSWLWGFIGALIAVPLLVIIKVFCDHFDSLANVGNFLSAQQGIDREENGD